YRSRNTGAWARTRSTMAGPPAVKSSKPTLRYATTPARRSARASARSRSEVSTATTSGLRTGRGRPAGSATTGVGRLSNTVLHLDPPPQLGRARHALPGQQVPGPFRAPERRLRSAAALRAPLPGPPPGQHELHRGPGRPPPP